MIGASKNQLDYVKGILDGIMYEANMYGVQFAADSDVRFYQRQVLELSNYDSQMKKNDIVDRLRQTLLSSRSIESIGIYWKNEGTFLSTSNSLEARLHLTRFSDLAGVLSMIACIILQPTRISKIPSN